ncbi:hypothetical protein GCM10017776_09170 [Streptomyces griseoluteus]|nr:hypothetical protein GCM10017776_09170 [Streptomyces griseoluteus]
MAPLTGVTCRRPGARAIPAAPSRPSPSTTPTSPPTVRRTVRRQLPLDEAQPGDDRLDGRTGLGVTARLPDSTYDTVAEETPAARATSATVTRSRTTSTPCRLSAPRPVPD